MEVHVISKKLIKPSIPTPSHLQRMSISSIDQFIPPRNVPNIFYYPTSGIGSYHTNSVNHVERLRKLEKSLSETLTLYYPLAGRLLMEKQLIHCNDEGVEYVEALIDGQLSQILQGDIEPKELKRLVPDDIEESATSPLVTIQISIFNCGGLAVGMLTSHRVIDGFSVFMFANGWAKACKVGINHVTIPNFATSRLFPPRDIPSYVLPPLSKSNTDDLVTKIFVFDVNAISKLKVDQATRLNCKPSTTEVLTALMWRAQINAARARHGHTRTCLYVVLMGLRSKRFKLGIPENCVGNLITRINARFDQANESEMGLNDFVDRVMGAVRNSTMEYAKAAEGDEDEFFSKVIMKPYKEIMKITQGEGDIYLFSTVRHMPLYEVDFGWGKPAWMSFAHRPYKAVLFMDAKDGDGIEVWVTMEESEMTHFQNDPDVVMALKVGRNGRDNTGPIPNSKM